MSNYTINYDDERFKGVEQEKNTALNQVNNAYNQMINSSDQFYQDQKNAVNDYKDQQTQLQQQQTDFAIQKIEQQKELAEKDYTKEQKGAYVDWQKQSNQFGANAEQMASQGLANTGFSESSQVSMFNTYQNRVTTAREVYNQATQNFNNAIQEARLANNSKLAEIAYNALQQSLQLSLEGFQYKNTLILDQINKQQETEDRYYSRWQDVQSQINTENSMREQIRQYEQDYAMKEKQYKEDIRQFNTQIEYYKQKDAKEYELEIKKLEEQKRQAQQAQKNWEKEYALAKSKASGSGGSSGGSGGTKKASASLTNTSSGAKLTNNSTPLDKSILKSSSSKGASTAEYNNVLKMARTSYNAAKLKNPRNATAMVDDIVARSNLSDSQIEKLYKSLGIK